MEVCIIPPIRSPTLKGAPPKTVVPNAIPPPAVLSAAPPSSPRRTLAIFCFFWSKNQ